MAIATIQGKAYFAKILGRPRQNYNKDGLEWTIGVVISEDTAEKLKQEGFKHKLKETPEGEIFVSFKHPEKQRDGTPNDPIRVYSPDGKTPWPQNNLIGNGSDVIVKFNVLEGKGKGGKPEMKWFIRAVQVFDWVPFVQDDGFEANPNAVLPKGENWEKDDD